MALPDTGDQKTNELLKSAFDDGVKEGKKQAFVATLTFLEKKYTEPPRPPRGSPEGKAILEVAKETAAWIRTQ